jgi:phosphatidyl-myo-inositol alpha-mannosyltransferase
MKPRLRILLTHPFSWPYVRRGAERFLHELSGFLAARGHGVTVLTSKPGPTETAWENGVKVIRIPQIQNRVLQWTGLHPETLFGFKCLPYLIRNARAFDVIHTLYFADAFAARIAKTVSHVPYILHMTGIPERRVLSRRPLNYPLMKLGLGKAAHVVVVSRVAALNLQSHFGRAGTLIPVPCAVDTFSLAEERDLQRPRILGVAAFSEPRKGARVLARAFALLKQRVPHAILQYSGEMPVQLQADILKAAGPDIGRDIEFLGIGEVEDLPRIYREAAVTVLPSLGDSFGMVLVESLASGTPVVGTRHGGIPDIISDGIGRMFEPGDVSREPTNAEGLADALEQTLELHTDPTLAQRCRAHADRFSWQALGPQIEDLYWSATHQ